MRKSKARLNTSREYKKTGISTDKMTTKLYRIEPDKNAPSNNLCGELKLGKHVFDWNNFIWAIPYFGPAPDNLDVKPHKNQQAFSFGCYAVPIVKSSIAALLEQHGCKIQRFPLCIKGKPTDWEIINVLDYAKRTPEERGQGVKVGWGYFEEESIELHQSLIEGRKLFRVSGERPMLFATEEIVSLLKEVGVSGLLYLPTMVKEV